MSSRSHRKRPFGQRANVACSSKRRRRLVGPVSASAVVSSGAGTVKSSPWASLDGDLVRLIAWRVLAGDLLDYVRFRAVCPNWRYSTICPRGMGIIDQRFHPRRWMLLPEGHGMYPAHSKLRGYIRFFNLSTGTFVRVKLPIFRDHCVLDSVDGLLVLQRDQDTAIRILHPFTGDIVDLPLLVTLAPHIDPELPGGWHPQHKFFYLRSVCACFSVNADGLITVMLALCRLGQVAFATSGDQQWTLSTWKLPGCTRPYSFQGKLYMVQRNSTYAEISDVFQINPPGQGRTGLGSSSLPPPKLIASCPQDKLARPIYLAECESQILLVGHTHWSCSHMLVYKLADIISEKYTPVTNIGDNALFMDERSLCVCSNKVLPTVASGTIIYIHQREGYLAQYDISSSTWSLPTDGCIRFGPVFGPCSLIQHIFTCCNRAYWNKGRIYYLKKRLSWRGKGKSRYGA